MVLSRFTLLASQWLQRTVCLWQTVSQAILSHVPMSPIWAAFQVTYCNAALNVGVLPAQHVHCDYSWESFHLAVIAGLCSYSWVPAWTVTWKAKSEKPPVLYPLHLAWATKSVSRVSCLMVLRTAESVDYPHVLRESTPCLKAVCIAPDSLYLQSRPMLVHIRYCVVSIMPWSFPVTTGLQPTLAEFLEAVCLLLSFSNYESLKSASWTLIQCSFDVFWWFSLFCPTCVTYKTAPSCEGRLEKPIKVVQ